MFIKSYRVLLLLSLSLNFIHPGVEQSLDKSSYIDHKRWQEEREEKLSMFAWAQNQANKYVDADDSLQEQKADYLHGLIDQRKSALERSIKKCQVDEHQKENLFSEYLKLIKRHTA